MTLFENTFRLKSPGFHNHFQLWDGGILRCLMSPRTGNWQQDGDTLHVSLPESFDLVLKKRDEMLWTDSTSYLYKQIPVMHKIKRLRELVPDRIPDGLKIRHYSFFMDNISEDAREAQRNVFNYFDLEIEQVRFTDIHAKAIDRILDERTDVDIAVLWDIDAIPLKRGAIDSMIAAAARGAVAGVAHCAGHYPHGYIFAGPECLCVNRTLWQSLGAPSALPTWRSDVMAELSWAADYSGIDVFTLPVTQVEDQYWRMPDGSWFGRGAEYGDGQIYHAFCSRSDVARFITRCDRVLSDATTASATTPASGRPWTSCTTLGGSATSG